MSIRGLTYRTGGIVCCSRIGMRAKNGARPDEEAREVDRR